MDELISAVTLCHKAGRAVFGFDAVVKSVLAGKTKLLLVSQGLSAKTLKELKFKTSERTPIEEIELSVEQIWYYTGKKAGIIAVNDDGFADKIKTILAKQEGLYGNKIQGT